MGYLATVLQDGSASALAPLVPAAGPSMIHGPENDPDLQLALGA